MFVTAVNRIVRLLSARQRGEITALEQQELEAWIDAAEANRQWAARCEDQAQVAASLEEMDKVDEEAAYQRFNDKNGLVSAPVISVRSRRKAWMAAAALIGVLAIGTYWWLNRAGRNAGKEMVSSGKGENMKPGSSQATLTLSDGRTITLDPAKTGTLAQEGGVVVNKQGGELVYNPEKKGDKPEKNEPVLYHTVSTPRGGNFMLTLPDNTKVWLNAQASIRYPTSFTGAQRKVEITGEAYFEVAKKSNQPFIVDILPSSGELVPSKREAGGGQVKVLGTHFNIRAYDDEEATKTTLLEGKVEVSANGGNDLRSATILKPGEQAAIFPESNKSPKIQIVDPEAAIAWKTGYFDFRATQFTEIMKELKRWYAGVEVIEIKEPINDQLTATISRNVPLSTMLTILEATGKVHFEVRDKTVIVSRPAD